MIENQICFIKKYIRVNLCQSVAKISYEIILSDCLL